MLFGLEGDRFDYNRFKRGTADAFEETFPIRAGCVEAESPKALNPLTKQRLERDA